MFPTTIVCRACSDLASVPIYGTIPPVIGNLTALEYIDLSGNNIFGSLPSEMRALK